jgi:hypothetical protein
MLPFKETKILEDFSIRKFSGDIDPIELMWHRDLRNREVKIVSGKGWKIQLENKLPQDLDSVIIPKLTWHRVIKGEGDLVIGIREWD